MTLFFTRQLLQILRIHEQQDLDSDSSENIKQMLQSKWAYLYINELIWVSRIIKICAFPLELLKERKNSMICFHFKYLGNLILKNVYAFQANGDILQFVSLDKGCYIGQELTARTAHTGVIRRRIIPFTWVFIWDTSKIGVFFRILAEIRLNHCF